MQLCVPLRPLSRPQLVDLVKALIHVKAHQRRMKDGRVVEVPAHDRNVQTRAERQEIIQKMAKRMAKGQEIRHANLASAVSLARGASKLSGREVHVYQHKDGTWRTTHDASVHEGKRERIVAHRGRARLHVGDRQRSLAAVRGAIVEHRQAPKASKTPRREDWRKRQSAAQQAKASKLRDRMTAINNEYRQRIAEAMHRKAQAAEDLDQARTLPGGEGIRARNAAHIAYFDASNEISRLRAERSQALDALLFASDKQKGTLVASFHQQLPAGYQPMIQDAVRRFNRLVGAQMMPTAAPHGVEFALTPRPGTRSYYNDDARTVYIDPGDFPQQGNGLPYHDPFISTMVHEMGHWLEDNRPDVLARTKAFLARRTAGNLLTQLQSFASGYRPDEWTRPDQFLDPYIGKVYNERFESNIPVDQAAHTEVLSMGIELFHADAVEFAEQDPDFFDFIAEVLGR